MIIKNYWNTKEIIGKQVYFVSSDKKSNSNLFFKIHILTFYLPSWFQSISHLSFRVGKWNDINELMNASIFSTLTLNDVIGIWKLETFNILYNN